MFMSLINTLRHRIALIHSLDQLLVRADDRLLDDIGLTRQDVRVMRQEMPGLLALRGAAPGGLRMIEA
jgi:uncharacterized protein YjiS (DUF1127 family)